MGIFKIFKTKEVVWPATPVMGPSGEHGKTFRQMCDAIILFAQACAHKWKDADTATEIAQEVAIKFWRLVTFQGSPLKDAYAADVARYVRRMVVTNLLNREKAGKRLTKKKQLYLMLADEHHQAALVRYMNPESRVHDEEDTARAIKALTEMAVARQTDYVNVRYKGLSYEEAAALRGTAVSTTRQNCHLAGVQIRRAIYGQPLLPVAKQTKAKATKKPKGTKRLAGSES
jgi:DNA-directed RNA polymerase specialized sigma24 family protein